MERSISFYCPILTRDIDPIPGVLDAVQQEASRKPTCRSNQVGGWQSSHGSLDWLGEPGKALGRAIWDLGDWACRQLGVRPEPELTRLEAWANLAKRGDWYEIHNHPGAQWSGVYYASHGGNLVLINPLGGYGFLPGNTPRVREVEPLPGRVVIFPSYVQHFTRPNAADCRVSVAFNLAY